MNFLLLSFSKQSEAEFIKTQVFTASSVCGASPAGAAATSLPHGGWRRFTEEKTHRRLSFLLKNHNGQRLAVTEPVLLLSTQTQRSRSWGTAPFCDVAANWKWAGSESNAFKTKSGVMSGLEIWAHCSRGETESKRDASYTDPIGWCQAIWSGMMGNFQNRKWVFTFFSISTWDDATVS